MTSPRIVSAKNLCHINFGWSQLFFGPTQLQLLSLGAKLSSPQQDPDHPDIAVRQQTLGLQATDSTLVNGPTRMVRYGPILTDL